MTKKYRHYGKMSVWRSMNKGAGKSLRRIGILGIVLDMVLPVIPLAGHQPGVALPIWGACWKEHPLEADL